MIRYVLALILILPAQVHAQDRTPSHCIALANAAPGFEYIVPTSLPQVARENVLLHYIAHASFLIRSHGGLNMGTDFTGFTGTLPFIPDVVTMNHAHDTHWTTFPDPAIPHVLPGWGPFGQGIEHRVDLGEVLLEALALAIPPFPRANGVDLGEIRAAPKGVDPMDDDALKPFAGLAGLRDKLDGKDE